MSLKYRLPRQKKPSSLTSPQSLKFWLGWGTGLLTAVALVLAAVLWMASSVYSELPLPASLGPGFRKVDVIVCLAGGRGRIRKSLELFDQNYGGYLYISGTDRSVHMKEILKELGWVGPLDATRMTIENQSTTTLENARVVSQFLIHNHLTSILLVTSSYHARRAYFIFQHVLPKNVDIQVTWYEREPFEPGDWWKSANGIWVTVIEYIKFIYAYVRWMWGVL